MIDEQMSDENGGSVQNIAHRQNNDLYHNNREARRIYQAAD